MRRSLSLSAAALAVFVMTSAANAAPMTPVQSLPDVTSDRLPIERVHGFHDNCANGPYRRRYAGFHYHSEWGPRPCDCRRKPFGGRKCRTL